MLQDHYQIIVFGAILAVLSILASVLSRRIGAPSLLLFLVIGMLAGEDGPGGIQFGDFDAAFLLGSLALALILLDGGLRTRATTFRVGLAPAVSLATLGVVITAGLVGAAASWLLDLSWQEGLLIGAVVGSTDAAAVFGLLHAAGLEIKQRCSATLEIESGGNDPMAIFLTVTMVAFIANQDNFSAGGLANEFLLQMGLGTVIGMSAGWGLSHLMARISLPVSLYPLLVMAVGVSVFAAANLWGGSGFLAIYLFGVLLANSPIHHLLDIRRFHDGVAWLSQIGMFLMLGLLVTPSNLVDVIYPGIVIAAVLMLAARPIAVILCLAPFRFPWREQMFVSWVGLKGAVPIILALYPYLSGLELAHFYFELTFFVVLLSLCLQGWTIAPLARLLGLDIPAQGEDIQQFSLSIPGRAGRELVVYQVYAGSSVDAYTLGKLPLATNNQLLGVIRNGNSLPVDPALNLEAGDYLILLADSPDLRELGPLFQKLPSPAHLQKTAFFGPFSLNPDSNLKDVAAFYGAAVPSEEEDLTIAECFIRRFHGRPVIGDRIDLGNVELVVREMMRGKIVKVGLKILSEGA